ncbi:MAG: hypothetical protein D6734_02555 [Candidatus Schekmanbacteria bacterium]|nr:MAG: hypothetical protein D6734_02555 [Candidatus Schekmanbacteria bacterium]
MELLKSGIPGLDEIFQGGIPRENCLLAEGPAGSGKTTFGLQFIYNGATRYNENGLIITLEEKPAMLYRDAYNYGWNLKKLEKENKIKIIPTSPQTLIDMISNPTSHINNIFEEMNIKRIFIDSISHFRQIAENNLHYRELINKLIYAVSDKNAFIVLSRELPGYSENNLFSDEVYLVDTVIRLTYESCGNRRRERFIEILKSRGQDYISGKHSFIFDTTGIHIFPSCFLKNYDINDIPSSETAKLSTGIEGLDEMLGGGLSVGKTALITGSSGTGKKTIGIQFLNEGFTHNENGLFVTLHNRPEDIIHSALSYSINLDVALKKRMLEILYRSPMELIADELSHSIRKICSEMNIRRVVIDSLNDLSDSIKDKDYFKNFLFSLCDFFSNKGITTILTLDLNEMFSASESENSEIMGLIPAVISLRYVELESEIRRAVSVIKVGGSYHDRSIHEYIISNKGMEVLEKFEGREGLMSGSPKKIDIQLQEILGNMALYERAVKKNRGIDDH